MTTPIANSISLEARRSSVPDLRWTGVVTGFGGVPVLRGVDLHVPAGAVTALLGASGTGKSTLVKHLLRLYSPDEGSVTIGGRDVWESTPEQLLEIHRDLSALHGGPTVYEGSVFASLSIRDNLLVRLYEKHANPSYATGGPAHRTAASNPYVKLWRYVAKRPVPPELVRHAQDWLDRFDLAEQADLLPHEVSAGQRRRMALAAALAVDVPLYVLDDFDGAIDAINREVVVDAVRSTHERTGATMLIVTHDPDLAAALADRTAVLSGGLIVFNGSSSEAIAGLPRWYRQIEDLVEPDLRIPPAREPSEPAGRGRQVTPTRRSGIDASNMARPEGLLPRVVLALVIGVWALFLLMVVIAFQLP